MVKQKRSTNKKEKIEKKASLKQTEQQRKKRSKSMNRFWEERKKSQENLTRVNQENFLGLNTDQVAVMSKINK